MADTQRPSLPVTLDDVKAAAMIIAGQVDNTPLSHSKTLSAITGAEIWVKFENLQFTAAFKERGALNKLSKLTDEQKKRGVIAASAGNHAQGVARAAGLAGLLFGRSPWRWAAPVLLIVPHLVGAPHPEGVMFPDQTPQAAAALELLARQFIGATAIANAVLWLALGLVSAWSVRRIHGAIGSGLTGQRDPEPFST